jgi:hypothetical protein
MGLLYLTFLQHKFIGFYNEMKGVLQRGTEWTLTKAVCASSLKDFKFVIHA